jgi:hypothetical protein
MRSLQTHFSDDDLTRIHRLIERTGMRRSSTKKDDLLGIEIFKIFQDIKRICQYPIVQQAVLLP